VEGVGDFNGDQQQDILWRNKGTGGVVVWFMAGTEGVDWRSLGGAGTDWRIEGVADFNADGQSDILWRNRQTGELQIWAVGQDFTLDTGSLVLPAVADLNWQIVGVADLNNDGMADILWNYMPSGFLGAWILEFNTTDRLKVRWDRDGTVFDSSQTVVHDGAPLGLSLWRTIAAPR
jgi:hypothetical protein